MLEDDKGISDYPLPSEWSKFMAKWDDSKVETPYPLLEVNHDTSKVPKVTYISTSELPHPRLLKRRLR